jgi:predicted permease
MNLSFDLKYAWRLLQKSWGYSLLCASVVALSVGLGVWSYSLAYAQILKPLGLPNSDRWYNVQIAADAATAPQPGNVDAFTYQEILKRNRSADYVGAFVYRRAVLSEGQASANLRAAAITPRVLAQVAPFLGRSLQPADGQPGAAAVAVISYETWQNYFASDRGIVGRTARIDSAPVQIVGVLPKDFYALQDFEVWMPLQIPNLARPGDSKMMLSPFIELRKEQDLGSILNEIKPAVERVNHDYPDLFHAGRHAMLIPAHRMFSYSATAIIAIELFMAAAVLVLGGVNISIVFLARLLERSRELALRSALGASRSRLLRQSLLETALVVVLGLVGGYGLAVMGVQWYQWITGIMAQALAAGRLESFMILRPIDVVVAVLFAAAIWLLSTLIPAWRISKQDAAEVLAGSGKGSSNRGRNRSAGVLVGIQMVISCLVLVICGSIALAVNKEVSKPTGLEPAQVMVSASPTLFDARFAEPARRVRYWDDLAASIRSTIPGSDVAFTTAVPSKPARVAASIETQQGTDKQGLFTLPLAVVSENYFKLLGMSLRSGRFFDTTDNSGSLAVAIVDEELAARYWPGENVLGKRVQLNPADNGPRLTVVGVVSAVGGRPYRKEDIGVLYQPLRQAAPQAFHLLAKFPGTMTNARVALRTAAFTVDRDLPLNNLQTLNDYLDALKLSYKAMIPPVTAVALITALISATGLFGLISRSVAQRTQEVGIRRALGATPGRVIGIFLRQGALYLMMAIVGVGLGVMVTPLLSRQITNILDYTIPVTFGIVVLMAAVVFMASYLPSRRAVALEPGEALRYE